MKRRLLAMLKRYEEHVGYPTEVSGQTVYEDLSEVLYGKKLE